jgi:hypothetical protein
MTTLFSGVHLLSSIENRTQWKSYHLLQNIGPTDGLLQLSSIGSM